MSPAASARARDMPRSGIRAIMEVALALPEPPIRLEIGDPEFATPPHIIDAAAAAAHNGFTHYTPSAGLPSLRKLIAEKVTRQNGFPCVPEQVVVTTGASGALHATLMALLDPGDEVLVPDPGWTTNVPIAIAAGTKPVPYRLDRTRGFAIDRHAIERRLTARTRALVVNSPANPTGAVATADVLEELLELTRRRGIWLISDECYEDIVFDSVHVSPAALDVENVVSIFSFSKSYAMTGWRVGYAVAPDGEIARLIARAQEPLVSSASAVSQKAAEAALAGPRDCVVQMREAYRRRRDVAVAQLEAGEIRYVRPGGTFYLMVDVSDAAAPEEELARRLLLERGVAVVPGTAFGEGGSGMVRISLAASEEAIGIGLERLVDLLQT